MGSCTQCSSADGVQQWPGPPGHHLSFLCTAAEHVQTSDWPVAHHGSNKLSPPLHMQPKLWLAGPTQLTRTPRKVLRTASPTSTAQAGTSLAVSQRDASKHHSCWSNKFRHQAEQNGLVALTDGIKSCWQLEDVVLCCLSKLARVMQFSCQSHLSVAGWGEGFKEVTLQYLDANNKIVNTQVAVPSKWPCKHCSAVDYGLIMCSNDQGQHNTALFCRLSLCACWPVAHHGI